VSPVSQTLEKTPGTAGPLGGGGDWGRPGPGGDGALPLGEFERPRSRVDHRSYAITWYGMAAVAAGVWIGWGIQQARSQGVGSV